MKREHDGNMMAIFRNIIPFAGDLDEVKPVGGISKNLTEKIYSIIEIHYRKVEKDEKEDLEVSMNAYKSRAIKNFYGGYLAACRNLTLLIFGKEKAMKLYRGRKV